MVLFHQICIKNPHISTMHLPTNIIVFFLKKVKLLFFLVQYICILILPDCSREYLLKKISWGSMPPNPPTKLTAAPLDRQISVFIDKTQSHACYILSYRNNDISYRDAMGFGDMFPEKFSND